MAIGHHVMRTLAITQNITVDGAIEFLDDWFDPTEQDDELAAEIRRQSTLEDVLLLGRRTFVEFRSFWPRQTTDTTGIARHLDRVAKYVVSSTLTDPGWVNSIVLGPDWIERVRALKQEDGGDIVATGSISLCSPLITAGLVDEYRLFVHPVVQGRGRRLFPNDGSGLALTLRGSTRFPSGVVLLTYART
jgi:dihydrofolate reductase